MQFISGFLFLTSEFKHFSMFKIQYFQLSTAIEICLLLKKKNFSMLELTACVQNTLLLTQHVRLHDFQTSQIVSLFRQKKKLKKKS